MRSCTRSCVYRGRNTSISTRKKLRSAIRKARSPHSRSARSKKPRRSGTISAPTDHRPENQPNNTLGDRQDVCESGFLPEAGTAPASRSEEHTSELQSRLDILFRLLLEQQ